MKIGYTDSDGPVPLELPEQWLWDIIDEFIYQFQSFCVWRSKVKSKTEEELALLADANQVRSSDINIRRTPTDRAAGLELLQCLERPVLPYPEVKNQRAPRCTPRGQER